MIILELGSGASCRNDEAMVRDMIDAISDVTRDVDGLVNVGVDAVLKFQLFTAEPPNKPLRRDVFEFAYSYGRESGYAVTASVFDSDSMAYLLNFDVPFIKIACRHNLYPLARTAHAFGVPTVVSYPSSGEWGQSEMVHPLACVPKYPAEIYEYEQRFTTAQLSLGISDHTAGLYLYHKYQPAWYEKHVVLGRDESNPDAGEFAMLISELEELV